ncbi:MAG: ABC-ATPase domain-containing protein [Fidelibacterota bacterium]|nr:MAG: ABC-ATPase domain-containing protein [Candidatus Neomarinimicrobiota bacterium]
MKPLELLEQQIQQLDGKDYGAYQSLKGSWQYPHFELHIDRIPKDPYAPPGTGVFRARVTRDRAGISEDMSSSRIREIALRDYLARQFHRQCVRINKGRRGTGNSGLITILEPGQTILERTSVALTDRYVEARFFIGMPASGRKIQAGIAESMLFEELPQILQQSLLAESLDLEELGKHLQTAEDAEFIRDQLHSRELVAFIADGAVLPRASGVDQRPLETSTVVRFKSPESLRVSFEPPNAGTITGMGIPKGVTLIVGGGYHGKSTLLQALELGIYNHIPGDGREYCVSLPETVKVRAASGRSVVNTDISAFIKDIPLQEATTSFSTVNASGSTSQAAFISEVMEVGAEVILVDEDTSATNFMIRDKRMQELVTKKHEPITAFVDRVRQLYEEHEISTILVMGGSGDYLSVADCVIQMLNFEPYDVSERAREIATRYTTERVEEGERTFRRPRPRFPLSDGLDPRNEYGHFRISAPEPRQLIFGQNKVDLADVEQLMEKAQTKAIGLAIEQAKQYMDGKTELKRVVELAMSSIREEGLDVLDRKLTGDLAQFRGLEFASVLNRMRSLAVNPETPDEGVISSESPSKTSS